MTNLQRELRPERPLAFDGYEAAPRRGPAQVALILSLLILGGFGGGVFWMYRDGLRAPGGPPEPVGAPVGDVRVAAPAQPQASDPAAGLSIYKDNPNAAPAAPTFAPHPEQVAPRPGQAGPVTAQLAPSTPTVLTPPPSAAPVAPAAVAQTPASGATPTFAIVAPSGEAATTVGKHAKAPTIDSLLADAGTAAPAKSATSAKVAKTVAAKTVLAKNAAAKVSASEATSSKAASGKTASAKTSSTVTAAAKDKSTTHGAFVVQIGAFSSKALAEKSWTAAAGVAPGAMAGKGKAVAQVDKPGGAILYRTAITGFSSREAAQALCAKLSAAGRTCFVR